MLGKHFFIGMKRFFAAGRDPGPLFTEPILYKTNLSSIIDANISRNYFLA
jgi:hypothetical protein